ncbi:hypothetical protein J8P63_003416 [Salmonella enterica]|nr:hypothetical protein [Salmonella enterica]
MTQEDFLNLNEKDQRSLVNIALREKGWRLLPDDFAYSGEYWDRLLMVNKGNVYKIETETPISLVCGLAWPYR